MFAVLSGAPAESATADAKGAVPAAVFYINSCTLMKEERRGFDGHRIFPFRYLYIAHLQFC
jgi:hypothetical protein